MNRRGFLQSLMIGASALAVDPERLLWTPGKKKIFIPALCNDVTASSAGHLLLTISFDDGRIMHWKSETVFDPAPKYNHLLCEATDFRFTLADVDSRFKESPLNFETH